MPNNEQEQGIPLTAIIINLEDRSVEFENQQGTLAKLTFPKSGTILFHGVQPILDFPQPGPDSEKLAQETPSPEEQKQPRVEFRGRLGFTPKLGTNADEIDYITLSVAVRDAKAPRDAKPDWRETIFYRDKAHQVAEMNLQKGEVVEVVAYESTREVTTRGAVKQQTVYNGTVIRRPK